MSKKHYKAIAALIRRRLVGDRIWRKSRWTSIRFFVGELEDFLAADNPRFDRQRFREACGF